MKKIIISEDKLMLLKESSDEVTFYQFFTELKNFIQDLLDDPIGAKPSGFFSSHGINRSLLLNKMLDRDIVSRKENIAEPNDADGNMKSMHYLQYKVPRKNFEQKIHRLYSYFFENGKRNKVNEGIEDVKPQKYNSVATYIFCKDKNGETCVLAGKRRGRNNGGRYNVPTGLIGDKYFNESVEDAAVREVAEESGIRIQKEILRDIGDEQYESMYGIKIGKNFMVTLSGTTDEHKPGEGDGENDKFVWVPVTQVNLLDWAFDTDKKIYNIANTL